MTNLQWWRGAVIYQIYPRSFYDANNDGIGDIRGVIEKLSYIKSLAVDAIWLSPFFTSPMKDFGYDISNSCDVDPIFGTLADFDELVHLCHENNIKVIIDQVLSHLSDQHAWFEESRQNRHNDKADWFVWADPKPDGTPPNNWLSIFGGSAWQWEPRRKQYYFHNFLASQPDVNFHCLAARQAVLDNVEFWLKRGVDGFRLDAINYCFHDQAFRDNPARPDFELGGAGFSADNPYAYQYHDFSSTRPENVEFMSEIRQLMDKYDNRVTLGEIGADDSLAVMAQYTQGEQRLNMAYSFELLNDKFSVDHIKQTVTALENQIGDGWPCWAIGNHDVKRVLTRWGKEQQSPQLAKMLTALVCSLRGSVCLYQGEELGLSEVTLEHHEIQDPYGLAFWPLFKGRDGCRTPMPWQASAEHAGFSLVKPWLPVAKEHQELAVSEQLDDVNSVLKSCQQFLSMRKNYKALVQGSIEFVELNSQVLSFIRTQDEQSILCCFNLSEQSQQLSLNDYLNGTVLTALNITEQHCAEQMDQQTLLLPKQNAVFILL